MFVGLRCNCTRRTNLFAFSQFSTHSGANKTTHILQLFYKARNEPFSWSCGIERGSSKRKGSANKQEISKLIPFAIP
jgi:hypothetical protein